MSIASMSTTRFRVIALFALLCLSALFLSSTYRSSSTGAPRVPSSWLPSTSLSGQKGAQSPAEQSKKPKPGKVVLVTASSGTKGFQSIPNIKEMVYENRVAYAHRHGYEHMWANFSSYTFGPKVYWNKIPILQEAWRRYPQAEWLWWLDLDIIIMTPSLDLESHILPRGGLQRQLVLDEFLHVPGGGLSKMKTPAHMKDEDVNFIIDSGGWGMNVGSFLMRRSEWSDWLLDMWADPLATAKDWIFPENDGWTHLWNNHEIVRKHTGLVKQRSMNAYSPWNPNGAHYEDGDLLVHFAGCGNNTFCVDRWQKMWDRKEHYEIPAFVKEKLADGTAEIENIQKGEGL